MKDAHQYLELLSPAKNLECGLAAVNAGADAVYIGADKFSARSLAGNSPGDIAALIQYAHKYYVKVYAAVNTIFTDRELEEAALLIHRLHTDGIDGVIIQDVGLLEMNLPPVPLIASTQMHNNTWEKVLFLEQAGFSRVILPRELSLNEIKAIREKTTVALEAFVHGALCVSYSGQCYMSYAQGGRSGNRGVCAQPCRKHYTLTDEKETPLASGYLLSLKDLNLSDHIEELIGAGITSFKIEGRLKDADYAANITAFYRKKIDAAMEGKPLRKAGSGKVILDFAPDPRKSFNRGFTTYFLNGGDADKASHGTPNAIGEYVGRIETLTEQSFILDSRGEMSGGDGVCFFDRNGRLQGTEIHLAKGDQIFFETDKGLWIGAEIYRNYDRTFQKKLKAGKTQRKISVRMKLTRRGQNLVLSITDEDGIGVEKEAPIPLQPARDPDQALQVIQKQLQSLGNTEFEAGSIEVMLSPMEFLPIRDLNALRREAVLLLRQARLDKYPRFLAPHTPNQVPYPATALDYRANALNGKAVEFYKRHGVKSISVALEKGPVRENTTLMTTRYCLLQALKLCDPDKKKSGPDHPLYLTDDKGRKFKLRFNCADCGMRIVT